MNGSTFSLTAMALLAMTVLAEARGQGPDEAARPASDDPAAPIQLAQSREVEIYIDQYGREVIVDAFTGEVIAIRPRERFQPSPMERRRARAEELRGDDEETYVRRVPLGQRLQQELEQHLGIREPAPDYESSREYRRRQRELYPREGYPAERFPDAPVIVPEYDSDIAGRQPLGPAPIERAPLGQPAVPGQQQAVPQPLPGEDGLFAGLPEESPEVIQDLRPGEQAVIPPLGGKGASEDVAKIQILLDRLALSPGVVDGHMGDNVNKAISAYKDKTGSALRTYDKKSVDEALEASGGPAFIEYEITPVDAAGPYVASVPDDYSEKAKLERLGYTSVTEALAERFHMDENYLKALNPGVNFNRPGTIIKVANSQAAISGKVTRILADKARKQVRAYDAAGRLLAAYPATIGSQDTPSPSGTVTVERVAYDPEYTYNPKLNFKQGLNDKVLTIPPGPNGPVGSIWIALSKPTYGIHGTPEPSKIGKTYSHGCVRLTNWDAAELAGMVEKGTVVEFVE
jgi:lipoprotein-anchoring transpeptidase ErfK/SrfK